MKLSNSTQMREIDRYVIDEVGIPGATLMTNASEHIALAAMEHLAIGGCVAVFCGAGNNGGDGIGAAAYLMSKGVPVRVFLVGDRTRLTPDSREMLRRLTALGGELENFAHADGDIERYLKGCGVIIDAMFGIGLNSPLRSDALAAVRIINATSAFVISADIASGVDADTGAILGDAVCADMTVTFSLAKPGHFIEPGCIRRGLLRICDIGISGDIIDGAASDVYAVMPEDARLPRRRPDSHKGDYGRCLIIAGSVGYTGAPALSARAATRMGAGLVYLGVPDSIYGIMATKCDEEMPFPLPDDGTGRLSTAATDEILRRVAKCDVCLIGPGLGVTPALTDLATSVIRESKAPIVLDADAITAIAANPGILATASCPIILTPHLGEFTRLTAALPIASPLTAASLPIPTAAAPSTASALLTTDRLNAARDFARTHKCALVLKGHRTITALPDGTVYINTTGGPAMAKGGSGDVLAGMIASLIGQKFTIKDAITTAVHLHGLSGDMCAAELGEYSVTASDIISMLPKAAKTASH